MNANKQEDHRATVAQYFSTRTRYWSTVYNEEKGLCYNFLSYHMRRRRSAVLKSVSRYQEQKGTILDAGCGSGDLLVTMTEMGHQVQGMDISSGMVAEARKCCEERGLNLEQVQQGAIEKIPHEDKSFDVITCVGVLEYVWDEKAALAELSRVLKDEGVIILTFPNLLKLQNLLDPYYFFHAARYILKNKIFNKAGVNAEDGLKQISTNTNYTNKRYPYHKISKIIKDSNLTPIEWVGLGYGPFTIGKKKIFSENGSKRISDFLENTISKFPFGDKYFTNRWVICLKKIRQ